jgi:hypothetical protein
MVFTSGSFLFLPGVEELVRGTIRTARRPVGRRPSVKSEADVFSVVRSRLSAASF